MEEITRYASKYNVAANAGKIMIYWQGGQLEFTNLTMQRFNNILTMLNTEGRTLWDGSNIYVNEVI